MSPAAICCGTPPTFAMMLLANPPDPEFKALEFFADLDLLPERAADLCAGAPVGMPRQLYSFSRSLSMSVATPNESHAMCAGVEPNGSAVPKVKAGSCSSRRVAWRCGSRRCRSHGVEHLEAGTSSCGKRLGSGSVVGDLGHSLAEELGSASSVSSAFGHGRGSRLHSGIDRAIAGAATALAARPTPPAFRNSRRFMRFLLCFCRWLDEG